MGERRKRGRVPYENYGVETANCRICSSITESELEGLERVAKQLKISKSKVIRWLIQGASEYLGEPNNNWH